MGRSRRAGRYVGEPVALVVAESRYIAEDAAELVEVEYAPLEAVIDPIAACGKDAPLLHPLAKTNEVHVREFAYGDTKSAFARADHRIATTVTFPRQSFTPIECYVVVAQHNPAKGSYDVLANFRARSRCIRSWRGRCAYRGRNCGCAFRRIRRQFRHQALGVSLCGAARARRRSPAAR